MRTHDRICVEDRGGKNVCSQCIKPDFNETVLVNERTIPGLCDATRGYNLRDGEDLPAADKGKYKDQTECAKTTNKYTKSYDVSHEEIARPTSIPARLIVRLTRTQ